MKCSICGSARKSKMVYCSMCQAWHCVTHFNSALIHRPGRTTRSPLVLYGRVEVHGDTIEATYRDVQLRLFLAEVATGKYLVRLDDATIGMIKKGPILSWDAYIDETLVGQRPTVAGAVGCIIDRSVKRVLLC